MKRYVVISCLLVSILLIAIVIGGLVMLNNMKNHRSEPVVGIAGYRDFNNTYYAPHFKVQLPSNWNLDERSLSSANGRWIALSGPANESQTMITSLNITMRETDTGSQYQSLDAYLEESIGKKSVGETEVLLSREIVVDGLPGKEAKIQFSRFQPHDGETLEIVMVIQWFFVFKEDRILEVAYRSPEENFDTYYDVYQKIVDTLSFQP